MKLCLSDLQVLLHTNQKEISVKFRRKNILITLCLVNLCFSFLLILVIKFIFCLSVVFDDSSLQSVQVIDTELEIVVVLNPEQVEFDVKCSELVAISHTFDDLSFDLLNQTLVELPQCPNEEHSQ